MSTRILFAAVLGGVMALPTAAAALEMRPVLSQDIAQRMADACVAKAKEEGWAMHIAIMDNGANLLHYTRMDNAIGLSHEISLAKARTSALVPQPTKNLQAGAFGDKGPTAFAFVPGLNFFEGGLPIRTAGGVHIGSIGVSGSTGENDGICAQAALDAVAADLQ